MTYRPDPPTGYMYVPLGNRDITEYCKEKCRERDREAHIVSVRSACLSLFLFFSRFYRQNQRERRARLHRNLLVTKKRRESTRSESDITSLQKSLMRLAKTLDTIDSIGRLESSSVARMTSSTRSLPAVCTTTASGCSCMAVRPLKLKRRSRFAAGSWKSSRRFLKLTWTPSSPTPLKK